MSEPRTKSGKALLADPEEVIFDANPDFWDQAGPSLNPDKLREVVLAIEAEAASPDALDVRLLAQAIQSMTWDVIRDTLQPDSAPRQARSFAERVATEYAALAAKLREAGEG